MVFARKSDWTVEQITEHIHAGESLVEIGEYFGLTRQRIKQICQRYSLPNTVETKARLRSEKYFAKWGDRVKTDLYDAIRLKYRVKKASATGRGIEWSVEFGELEWPEHCPILGIPMDYFAESRVEGSPSFDRIDPAKGYIAGNVQIVSWRANRIKNDGSASEHRLIADYLDSLSTRPLAS